MSMATRERPSLVLQLEAQHNDDPALTCLLCLGANCSHVVTYRVGGKRIWVGVHDICAAPLSAPVAAGGGRG